MESFSEAPNDFLYMANGLQNMLRWEGLRNQFEPAGVDAPAEALILTGNENGPIVGTLYAYARYVDQNGNFSNVSPVSDPYDAASITVLIGNVKAGSPVQIRSALPTPVAGTVFYVRDVTGTTSINGRMAVANTGGMAVGTALQPLPTDGSPAPLPTLYPPPVTDTRPWTGQGTISLGIKTLTFSNLPLPTDPKVVRRQIMRTKPGALNVAYIVLDTTDLTSTSLNSDLTDDELTEDLAVALLDDQGNDLALSFYSIPPNDRPFITHHSDRLFACGSVEYVDGAVSVTAGNKEFVGIGTEWKSTMAGRVLEVQGAQRSYIVESFDETAQTGLLTEEYADATDPFATYAIRNSADHDRFVDFSASGLPEAFPFVGGYRQRKRLPDDYLSGRVTGSFSMSSWYYVFCLNRLYRLTYRVGPNVDGEFFKAAERGCINQHCYVLVEDQVFALDGRGVYVFSGGQFDPLSLPIQPIFEAHSDSQWRINWSASKTFHAAYDQNEEIIRFCVAFGASDTPRHCLCVDFRTKRWWLEEHHRPITASCSGRIDGLPRLFFGSDRREVLSWNRETLDGPTTDQGTTRGTVTNADLTWFEDSTATFPDSRVVGFPVTLVASTGEVQVRRVVEVQGVRIWIDQSVTWLPTTTTLYQLGGIPWSWKSGWYRWAEDDTNQKRRVEVQFKKTVAAARMSLRSYHDFADDPEVSGITQTNAAGGGLTLVRGSADYVIDTTKSGGVVMRRFDDRRETESDGNRFVSLELRGVTNGERQRINQLNLEGASSQ